MKPLCLIALFCCLTLPLSADNLPDYRATVSNERLKVRGTQVEISFTLDLGERVVQTQHRRVITPVIATADGSHTLLLQPVVVNGHNRAIKEQRAGRSAAAAYGDPYVVLTGNKAANRTVDYRVTAPYDPWMDNARFTLREEVTGCACGDLLRADQIVKEQAIYMPLPVLTARQTCPVEYTPRSEERDAFLIYPVNRIELYPDRYSNRTELQKIDSALEFVRHNPDYEIQRIEVTGYASPEGTLRHNVYLAEGRAQSLKRYITDRYTLPDTLLTVTPGAENWDGLVAALRDYELPYKADILRLIDEVPDLDRREELISQVGGGVPYQILLHAIYPSLRKNTFRIAYISRERTPEKARQLAFTSPAELNVHEFYTIADTYYAADPDTCRILQRLAADTYPQHRVANLNAAVACLESGDLSAAELYIDRAGNTPEVWTLRACLLWMQGDRQQAERWWRRAAEAGDETARQNLSNYDLPLPEASVVE